MTVGRLWGTNEVEEVSDGFHLVVATPDKLDTRVDNPDYDWLTETSVVVVDEAHPPSLRPTRACWTGWAADAPVRAASCCSD